jgi:hypothetical protein
MDAKILDLEAASKQAGELIAWVLEHGAREIGEAAMGNRLHRQAEHEALMSIVKEMAGRDGISGEQFDDAMRTRTSFFLHQAFQHASDSTPSLKARMSKIYDQEAAASPADSYEAMFPEQQGGA